MDRDKDGEENETRTPPDDVDTDEHLDAYDEEVAGSFPASDPPSSASPRA
jgi:hypothetical protein